FMLGKVLISYYLVNFAKISAFGAASSLIILLLWVYYSSIILYTGAEFTHAYSVTMGRRIEPNNYAVLNSREAYERRKALEELKKEEEDLKNDDESGTKIGLE
ncbi:MAG: YihY/virulence factor BrkB family protein, partial [Bacteroidia bacterium]|nr:YihY/virulence factor BrkB family protein [Bacteroidia bacterium]